MSYILSNNVVSMLRSLPDFKTDLSKVKSMSALKNMFNINSEENIISYRAVTKLMFINKIENGGIIFTNRAVHINIPDFYKTTVYYINIPSYIPIFSAFDDGYSLPELWGDFNGDSSKRMQFWNTDKKPVSNKAITDAFWAIINDVVSQDGECRSKYETTRQQAIDCLVSLWENKHTTYLKVLDQLICREYFTPEQKATVLYIYLCYYISTGGEYIISQAYDYVALHSDLLNNPEFIERIKPTVIDTIEKNKELQNDSQVNTLRILCMKYPEYLYDVFPDIINFYFTNGRYSYIDTFIEPFKDTEFIDELNETLNNNILEMLPIKMADWENDPSSDMDKNFAFYALDKPYTYELASKGIIEHYCKCGAFDEATKSLIIIRKTNDNNEFIQSLEDSIIEYQLEYAQNEFSHGNEYFEADDMTSARKCYLNAVKYNCYNQEYALALIQTDIRQNDFYNAKNDIQTVLGNSIKFDDANIRKFQNLEISAAEGITNRMGTLYDKIKDGDVESVINDFRVYFDYDQLKLDFYYYAILLRDYNTLEFWGEKKTIPLGNNIYNRICFACGTPNIPYNTLSVLLLQFDDDAQNLLRKYKLKQTTNTVKNIATSIVGSALSEYVDMTVRVDQKAQEQSLYVNDEDTLADVASKREQLASSGAMASEMKVSLDSNKRTSDDISDEYVNAMTNLIVEKYDFYREMLEKSLNKTDLQSVMVYLVIKNPDILEEIFHGDRETFKLYEENGTFWYLPESLINNAIDIEKASLNS